MSLFLILSHNSSLLPKFYSVHGPIHYGMGDRRRPRCSTTTVTVTTTRRSRTRSTTEGRRLGARARIIRRSTPNGDGRARVERRDHFSPVVDVASARARRRSIDEKSPPRAFVREGARARANARTRERANGTNDRSVKISRRDASTVAMDARAFEAIVSEPWGAIEASASYDDAFVREIASRFEIMTADARRGAVYAAACARRRMGGATHALANVARVDSDEWVRAFASALNGGECERFDIERMRANVPAVSVATRRSEREFAGSRTRCLGRG